MAFLVTCFVVQSSLVYFDPSPEPGLSHEAQLGRTVWHRHNCQSCHQFYGFGGFLGPDLTNATSRVTTEHLTQMLTEGSGQMPAFHLADHEISAVAAFLSAMNETGQGQAKLETRARMELARSASIQKAFREVLAETDDSTAADGHRLFVGRGCMGCHFSPTSSVIGAPDLVGVCDRLSREEIMTVFQNGRSPGMPPTLLSADERETVHEFFLWLREHQDSIRSQSGVPEIDPEVIWSEIPWWEFGS